MIFIEQDIITKGDKSYFTMSKLTSAPYRRGQENLTKMLVGCIKLYLVSINILVHLCVGMLTLVTSLSILRYKQVSI
jgi:hypothetical protein